ncbi:MAG TPA: hypothetical protein VK509_05545 [Polyangiales bacterium]|nr:hypothetical protein [Polyangiales bacterium]
MALVALLCSASCGVRTAVSAEADWEDNKDDGGQKPLACGYGPPCNPRNFGGQSCTSLGLKPGALSCDPETCFLVLTGCGKSVSTGTGGTGGPAPMPGATPLMDAGALFGGLFGAGAGAAMPGAGSASMPGGLPMDDEDGGMAPGIFGQGFFGGNPGMGIFGGNPGMGIFGAQGGQRPGQAEDDADGPAN